MGLAHRHALVAAGRHRRSEQNLDAKFLKRLLGIGRKILRKDRQHAGTSLDEQHTGVSGVNVAEFRRQRLMGKLCNHACHFHAGRACPYNDKG